MSHEQDPCNRRINGIESIQVCKQGVLITDSPEIPGTMYQDMLEVWHQSMAQ